MGFSAQPYPRGHGYHMDKGSAQHQGTALLLLNAIHAQQC